MRRSISLVLAVVMLLSVMVFTVPSASAASAEPKLDWGNSYATAYYYGGMAEWYEVTGTSVNNAKASKTATLDELHMRKDYSTDDVIKLDGTIEEGEWGKKSLSVSSLYAGRSSGKNGQKNVDMDEPAKDNSYYFMNFSGWKEEQTPRYFEMQFDAYFLWDEEFFYMAVDVTDPDGFYNMKQSAQEGAWNGDALQFRIDPDGPNSIVDGEGYDAKTMSYPWKRSEMKNSWQENYSEIPNFVISLTAPMNSDINGSTNAFVERWDAAKRYDVTEEATEDGGTQLVGNQADVSNGVAVSDDYVWDPVYASVTTTRVTGQTFRTQYEIAIPWAYMDSAPERIASGDFFTPEVGMQLGMALSLFNGPRGAQNGYTSSLSWGTGVTNECAYHHYEMAGGSNCLILDGTPFREADICEHETFADPTCEHGYKCTNCGYEKGLALGHTFEYSDASLPTADATGGITGTCKTCGTKVRRTIPTTEYKEVASFKETDTGLTRLPDAFDSTDSEDEASRSGWTKQWVYSDEPNKDVPYKDPVTGQNRNAYEVWNGEAVANLTELRFTGTAFYGKSISKDALSFSQAMDIYMTGYSYRTENGSTDSDNANNMYGDEGYTSGIYTTYGGNEKTGYQGGLFYIPKDDQYYFALIRTNRNESNKCHTSEEFEKWALVYEKVSKEEAAGFMNNWHNLEFVYDDITQTGFVLWDGELRVAGFIPLSKHDREGTSNTIIMRTFDVQFYAKNIVQKQLISGEAIPDVITRPGEVSEQYTATINGVSYQYAAGEQVTLTAEAFYLDENWGYRFEAWTGDVAAVADVTANTTTFTMPAQNVTITAKHYLIGDVDGNGVVDSVDAAAIIRMANGTMTPTLVGDITGTGVVDAMSAANIARYIAGTYTPTK